MAYETLEELADAGGERTSTPRGTVTEFTDGYTQTVYQGLQPISATISFTRTGDYSRTKPIEDFFTRNVKKPFWYSFDKREPLQLYELTGTFTHRHVSGLTWTVSATFKEYDGL